jgi:two-component system cell cycle response regulator
MDQDFGATTQILKVDLAIAPRVLLVDDDELVLERLQAFVAAAGFEVCTAADGAQALALLEQTFAPIVIMDLNMPQMDGLTVCRALRGRSWPGYVYIILLTSRDAEEDILTGLSAGADDYLSKRASSAQLLARLRTAQRILTLEHSLKNALAEKRQLAMTDALTGAPNRRFFMRRLSAQLERRRSIGGEVSLLVLDIDHFKQINDRHGHAAGDAVLQEFVRRMNELLRPDVDWCARIGGEEFAVVIEGATGAATGAIAERLRHSIAASPFYTPTGNITVTVSIGVSALEAIPHRAAATVESLLQVADQHLYASKQNGRNRVTLPGRSAQVTGSR